MRRTTCKVCKQQTETIKYNPIVNKQKFPICSDNCFKIYKNFWKDEKNFPENVINYSQSKQGEVKGETTLFVETEYPMDKKITSNPATPKRIFTEEDGIM